MPNDNGVGPVLALVLNTESVQDLSPSQRKNILGCRAELKNRFHEAIRLVENVEGGEYRFSDGVLVNRFRPLPGRAD
jgi:hypothetical protein